jgi:PAS domain S-box-containing protein
LSFDQNFLKTLTVLYVEDDAHARSSLVNVLEKVVHKVYVAEDGRQGLEYFKKQKENIDIIVSDINMPHMDGLELLESVRYFSKDIPFIFTTAHQDNDFLLGALKFGVTHYANKPVDIKDLMLKIQSECMNKYQFQKALHMQKESELYLNILNQMAIVSQTDLVGDITYVNDTFCDVSGYEEVEIIGNKHSIVAHPNTPDEVYQEMWSTLRKKEKWIGKLKNKNKDGESYFVNANIFPIFDDFDSKVIGYMSIQFLTTTEENEKREYKTHIRQMTIEQKKIESDLRKQISSLEKKINNAEYLDMLEESASKATSQNKKLLKQMQYYEAMIKKLKQEKIDVQKAAKEHFFGVTEDTKLTKHQNAHLENRLIEIENLVEKKNQEIFKLTEQMNTQSKVIFDLKDVIAHKEDQLAKYEKNRLDN